MTSGLRSDASARDGRLLARSHPPSHPGRSGLHSLAIESGRDGVIFVPPFFDPEIAMPLAVMLHGAGGNGRRGIESLLQLATDRGLILMSPDARQNTWDVLYGDFGPDVAYIDRALEFVFDRYTIDPEYVMIEGFSDGASYALSLGITNGDLFTHIGAFSPGFMAPAATRGTPTIFVTHGIHDQVLPISICSRKIVPRLQRDGYDVEYHEFNGPHTVPPELAERAIDWFLTVPD